MDKLSGLVLDFYDDPDGEVLKQVFPTQEDVPELVKEAHSITTAEHRALPDDAFALILEQDGVELKKYATVDPGNTALSVEYFLKTAHKLPWQAQAVAAHNLCCACDWHGIRPPTDLIKVAKGAFLRKKEEPLEEQQKVAGGVIKDVASKARDVVKTIAAKTPRKVGEEVGRATRLAATGAAATAGGVGAAKVMGALPKKEKVSGVGAAALKGLRRGGELLTGSRARTLQATQRGTSGVQRARLGMRAKAEGRKVMATRAGAAGLAAGAGVGALAGRNKESAAGGVARAIRDVWERHKPALNKSQPKLGLQLGKTASVARVIRETATRIGKDIGEEATRGAFKRGVGTGVAGTAGAAGLYKLVKGKKDEPVTITISKRASAKVPESQKVVVSRLPKVRKRQLEALKSRGLEGPTKTAVIGPWGLLGAGLLGPGAVSESKKRLAATKGTGGQVVTPAQMRLYSAQQEALRAQMGAR